MLRIFIYGWLALAVLEISPSGEIGFGLDQKVLGSRANESQTQNANSKRACQNAILIYAICFFSVSVRKRNDSVFPRAVAPKAAVAAMRVENNNENRRSLQFTEGHWLHRQGALLVAGWPMSWIAAASKTTNKST